MEKRGFQQICFSVCMDWGCNAVCLGVSPWILGHKRGWSAKYLCTCFLGGNTEEELTFILQVCIALHVHSESVNMVISVRQIVLPSCEVYDYWWTIGQVRDDNPYKVLRLRSAVVKRRLSTLTGCCRANHQRALILAYLAEAALLVKL